MLAHVGFVHSDAFRWMPNRCSLPTPRNVVVLFHVVVLGQVFLNVFQQTLSDLGCFVRANQTNAHLSPSCFVHRRHADSWLALMDKPQTVLFIIHNDLKRFLHFISSVSISSLILIIRLSISNRASNRSTPVSSLNLLLPRSIPRSANNSTR